MFRLLIPVILLAILVWPLIQIRYALDGETEP